MDNSRMSTADMLQYCDEALAWEEFGPVDIFFFESVKKILLGQCSAFEQPETIIDDYIGIERPVTEEELAPDYDKYDDYYYEEGAEESDITEEMLKGNIQLAQKIFNSGFFVNDESLETAAPENSEENNGEQQGYTINI